MKHVYTILLVLAFNLCKAQLTVPYVQDFDAYPSFAPPNDWTHTLPGFQIYPARGVNNTQCLTRQLGQFSTTDSIISPGVEQIAGNPLKLSFDYRIVEYIGTFPLGHALAVGDRIEIGYAADNGSFTTLGTIDQATHGTSANYVAFNAVIPLTAVDSFRIMIKGVRASGDFNIEIDNFTVDYIFGVQQFLIGDKISVTQQNNNIVNVLFADKEKAQVMLLNTTGQLYFEDMKFKNRDMVSIDTNGIAPGIYFLQIDQGKKRYAQKLKIN